MNRRPRKTRKKPINYDSLEQRCVLTFILPTPFADGDQPIFTQPSSEQPVTETAINEIEVSINGDSQFLSDGDTLGLNAGDDFSVLNIEVQSPFTDGVFAAEAYLNKLGETGASQIDYSDGRFSERQGNFAANGATGFIDGLEGSWSVESGWDRLTISLVHYSESGVEVASIFRLNVTVGEPDLALTTDLLDKWASQEFFTNERIAIPGLWQNVGQGDYHNYAEADVFFGHDVDTVDVVWAGALVGNSGDAVEGFFTNVRGGDNFDGLFVAQEAGEYIIEFTVDPENSLSESNEDNNKHVVKIKVNEAQSEASDYDFQKHDDLRLTFVNEQQFAWGFGIQNDSDQAVENWAVQIQNATYVLDASQLTNQSAFELFSTDNGDGTYDYLFVGTSDIERFSGIPGGNIEWHGVNFGEAIKSSSFEVGVVVVS